MGDIYLNIRDYQDDDYPFQIFIGCRGMGKTYSSLKSCYENSKNNMGKFIYMRRTQKQLDSITDGAAGEGLNPFKVINSDIGWNVGFRTVKKDITGIFDRYVEDGTDMLKYFPYLYGYGIALSTVASIRGIDTSDCVDWVYDEFIKEKHERLLNGEFDAIMNAYETFCRNREFSGKPPIRFWALSNATDIYNVLFKGLGIVNDAEKMARNGIRDKYYKNRGLAIHLLKPSEAFIQMKENTALARLTRGTEFYDSAFKNEFAYNDFSLIGYRNLKGYRPVVSIDNAYIYEHKGDNLLYVCYARGKCEHYSSKLKQDVIAFRRRYGIHMVDMYADGGLFFESYELKEIILNVLGV